MIEKVLQLNSHLKSVTVQENVFVVTLSPLQAVFKIIMWGVIIIVVVGVVFRIIMASEGSAFALGFWW